MSIGKRKSTPYTGLNFNKRNPVINTDLMKQIASQPLTDAERKKLGMPDLSLTSGLLSSMAPNKETAVPATTTPPVIPKALATDIPKFTKFGDRFASMGGLDKVLSQDDLAKMTQEEVDAYSKKRSTGKNRGTSDLLMALGTAFKGGDIVGSVQSLRNQRSEEDEADRVMQLNQEISEAYASGDYDLVNQLMLEKGDPSATQAISNRINKERNIISDDGKLIYTLDKNGNIIDAKPNKEVLDYESANKPLPSSLIDDEIKDEDAITLQEGSIMQIADFRNEIESGNLNFGNLDSLSNFTSNYITSGAFTDKGKIELANSNAFNRFKGTLRDRFLAMETGTKTDNDAERALERLDSAKSKDDVLSLLDELEMLSEQQIANKRRLMAKRRESAGVKSSASSGITYELVE